MFAFISIWKLFRFLFLSRTASFVNPLKLVTSGEKEVFQRGIENKKRQSFDMFHSDSSYYINDKPRNSFCINVSLENTWPFQSRLFCRRISMNADSLFKVRIQNTVIERLLTWSSRCLQPSRSSWSFIISLSTPSTIVASPSRFALQN